MREDAFRQLAAWIVQVLAEPENEKLAGRVRGEIRQFVRDYPVPADASAIGRTR
jgi:glycine hydroxymethyltransferase